MNGVGKTTSGIDVSVYRELRKKARELLGTVQEDLRPFQPTGKLTFLRTPDSKPISGDVNVTTTCSCVMALAATRHFRSFYKNTNNAGDDILQELLDAPWMSSGLILNNAFTTTLVLRTYGFLVQHGLLKSSVTPVKKKWDLSVVVQNPKELAERLAKEAGSESHWFLYRSLSDKTREELKNEAADIHDVGALLAEDIRRIMQSGWIHERTRFPDTQKEIVEGASQELTTYKVTQLNYDLLAAKYGSAIRPPQSQSFQEIAEHLTANPEMKSFRINNYPASPAVVYWFVDGISRASMSLPTPNWTGLCVWARNEFHRQHSLVQANRDALMDPVAMAMAACLCTRLRLLSSKSQFGLSKDHLEQLPSQAELQHAIRTLVRHQSTSGIWPKYFPMFHYQDQGAGSNFCFTFELLEAVLNEFGTEGSQVLDDPLFIGTLEKALEWCLSNRLEFTGHKFPYAGWNSGGYIQTLQKNQPESWATAVVHMFLHELDTVLSKHIQRRVLQTYKATPPAGTRDHFDLEKTLDIDIVIEGKRQSLKEILRTEFVCRNTDGCNGKPRQPWPLVPTSALLFGPPGTSKTQVVQAVAKALNWPLLVITPSEFVKGSLAQVYVRADEIFQDVMDLSDVVVFFDEMDALMQSREKGELDTATQFLTTAMLPKLAELHHRGRVIFFMATNYQDKFDPAIKRAGRFDLLLCMGPPTLEEKVAHVDRFYNDRRLDNKQAEIARRAIREFVGSDVALRDQLALFTYAEFRSFLNLIDKGDKLGDALQTLGPTGFKTLVVQHTDYAMLKLYDLPEGVRRAICEWTDIPPSKRSDALSREIGRYLRDRSDSRRQY